MKRYFSMRVLCLAVALVATEIVFLVPATVADLDGSTWTTDFDPIVVSQKYVDKVFRSWPKLNQLWQST